MLEPGERKLYTMVQQLNTIRNAKVWTGFRTPVNGTDAARFLQVKKREEQQARRRKVYAKARSKEEAKSTQRVREERKRRYVQEGRDARKKARSGGGVRDADD